MTHDGTNGDEELLSGLEGENPEAYSVALQGALRRMEEVRPIAEKKLEEILKMYPADDPLVARALELKERVRRKEEDYHRWSERQLRERLGIGPDDNLFTHCQFPPGLLEELKRRDLENEENGSNCTSDTGS